MLSSFATCYFSTIRTGQMISALLNTTKNKSETVYIFLSQAAELPSGLQGFDFLLTPHPQIVFIFKLVVFSPS